MHGRSILALFLSLTCGSLLPSTTSIAGSPNPSGAAPAARTPSPIAGPRLALPAPRTHEEVVDRVISNLNRMVSALLTIRDADTAQAAVDKMNGIATEMRELAVTSRALGKPTPEQAQALQTKMAVNAESMKQQLRFFPVIMQKAGPGAATIVGDGMKSFTEAMQEVGKMFGTAG